jgi:hypothetical protein
MSKVKQIFAALAIAIFAGAAAMPARSDAAVFISVSFGPPALPVYYQPPAPAPNLIWQPGYWAWGSAGYYWVPGTWVAAPRLGLLWTPGWWGWSGGYYAWHPGYWATHVGFYGGVNYGWGYFGHGYVGGAWYGNVFRYNTYVTHVNTTVVRNVYVDRTVYVNNNYNRISYNGGPGGINSRPTQEEMAAQREQHWTMTSEQREHVQTAQANRNYLASVNNGHPTETVAPRPLSVQNRPASYEPVHPEDRTYAQHNTFAQPQHHYTPQPQHYTPQPQRNTYAEPQHHYTPRPQEHQPPAHTRPAPERRP